MSFALYVIGFVIMIVGLALGASYMHVPVHWIVVGVLVMIGVAVASGVSRSRPMKSACSAVI